MKTQIQVLKAFTFTYPNGEKEDFAPGLREIDPAYAEHFFVKAHCGEAAPDGADLLAQLTAAGSALIDMRNALDSERAHANDLGAELLSVNNALTAEQEKSADLAAQLAASTPAADTEAAMAALATANADLTAQLAAVTKKK